MPLGREIGLRIGNTVLTADPAPPSERGTAAPAPNFWPMPIVLLRFQNVSCRSVLVGFAEKTSVFGLV